MGQNPNKVYFEHGNWMMGNRRISRMWKDEDGLVYYEDVPEVHERGLRVRPDLKKDDE